ncbi:MAG: RNA polymerase sigma factor [Pirellulaceae bacterium]
MGHANQRQWVLEAVDRHELGLLRYALRLVGEEGLARDAVQHAFLKLWDDVGSDRWQEHAASPPGGRDLLAAWLFRVCRNRCLDHLRTEGREQPLDALPSPGREIDPAEAAESDELAACLRELVARLPAAQREAIDLWCEGFRYGEIGEITGHKEGHVRVLVHRGLARVREAPQVRAWLSEEQAPAQ